MFRKGMSILVLLLLIFFFGCSNFDEECFLETDTDVVKAGNYLRQLSVELTEGTKYGCDLLCFIDEYGLCYNLPEGTSRKQVLVHFELFKNEKQLVQYKMLLNVEDQQYCLGELNVFVGAPTPWHSLCIRNSPICDLQPIWIDWSMVQTFLEKVPKTERAGIIQQYNTAEQEVTVMEGKLGQESVDFPIGVLKETISDEQTTLRITSNTLLTVWGDEMEMIVTPNRFFKLLESGYPYEEMDFYFCYENGEMLYLREIYQS